ncbi:MAG: single-stranded-DNA-specific exonuclease RecJ [Chloroflexi bacterium]|nr:single-stranded-DNA-specific exonuclease RecJ [Chloroflexota bacterium]
MTDAQRASLQQRWTIAPRIGDAEQARLGADSMLLTQLLWNRGVRTAEDAGAFFATNGTESMADPLRMHGVPAAVDRLRRAIGHGELIAVYGDYDVDGLAGAALLVETLQRLGGRVVAYIPHRTRDGYGVNAGAVSDLAAQGARVIMTVDCGITAGREIELAAALGVDAIVTDHHTVPAELPAAAAVLNPHQPGCDYPFKELAGGGVAYQLARALHATLLDRTEARRRDDSLATLAALSTVADVVPLTGENRTIVTLGLASVRAEPRPGFQAICERANRSLSTLSARDLAFAVIPRLNAAGRMGDARLALDTLLAADLPTARALTEHLEEANVARRDLVDGILDSVAGEASRAANEGSIVLAGDYSVGVAGLIAGRLAEQHSVPCVVIECGEEASRGSVRGPDGLNLMRVLQDCSDTLIQFGGHERAAGFSLRSDQVDAFRDAFHRSAQSARVESVPQGAARVDAVLRLSSVGTRLATLTERFEPTGAGNSRPSFMSSGLIVRSAQRVNGGHIRLRLAQGSEARQAVAFRPQFDLPLPGSRVDVLYEVERSHWLGEERVELVVRDLRPSSTPLILNQGAAAAEPQHTQRG